MKDEIIAAAVAIVPDQIPPDRLSQARALVERAMHILDLQLAEIRHEVGADSGNNARWWAKATAAQRIKGKQRQRLQTLFSDVNRLLRAQRKDQDVQRQASKERRFIQLAKSHLGDTRYLEVWRTVNEEFDRPNRSDVAPASREPAQPMSQELSEKEISQAWLNGLEIERLKAENADLRRRALDKPLTAAMSIANSHTAHMRVEIERLQALALTFLNEQTDENAAALRAALDSKP